MQKKYLNRLWVSLAGAGLCLLAFGVTAFAQAATTPVQMVAREATITSTLASEPGVLIVGVETASPAAKAGLARGDILLRINEAAVNTVADVQTALGALAVGDSITVTARHGDDTRSLNLTLGERQGRPFLGIVPLWADQAAPSRPAQVVVLSKAATAQPVMTPTVRVLAIVKDSPAEQAGLQTGDALLAINGKVLSLQTGLAKQIQGFAPGDVVTVTIQRNTDEQTLTRTITLGKQPDHPTQAFLGVKVAPAGVTLFQKTMVAPGAQIPYLGTPYLGTPYLGWWMPAPYYSVPLMVMPPMMMPYSPGFALPTVPGSDQTEDFLFSTPAVPADGANFFYQMPVPQAMPVTPGAVESESVGDDTL